MPQTWSWTPPRRRVLATLVEADSPVWPVDLARQLGIPYGTVYSALRKIYDLGWAVGTTQPVTPGRPPRVVYRLTSQGREHAPALLSLCDNDKET